ncbi:MAG: hypothetical protein HYX69_03280 [Planctomycetia bacterium]|nr:hypothetical protein [Planctomycetia bacterium]
MVQIPAVAEPPEIEEAEYKLADPQPAPRAVPAARPATARPSPSPSGQPSGVPRGATPAPSQVHGLYDTMLKKDMGLAALAVALLSFAWLAGRTEWSRWHEGETSTQAAI